MKPLAQGRNETTSYRMAEASQYIQYPSPLVNPMNINTEPLKRETSGLGFDEISA